MKFLRLVSLLLVCSGFCFAVNKDIVQLQRDLEARMNALQNDLDSKLGAIDGRLSAMQNDTRRTADQVATLQDAVSNGVTKSLAPVAGLGARVDSMGDDVRSLKDALADLSARLERMDAKLTDLKNQLQIIQSPPPAPGVTTGPGASIPQAGLTATPPPGVSADRSYTDAVRDLQTGKADLARNEFQQYLTYFPNTELAPRAQYYLGEIDYNRGDYAGAVKNFDLVLEHYPENPKTADAHLMKGLALLKSNQRNNAVQEFRALNANYPHTDQARKALQQLRSLGVSAASAPSKARR